MFVSFFLTNSKLQRCWIAISQLCSKKREDPAEVSIGLEELPALVDKIMTIIFYEKLTMTMINSYHIY